MHEGSARQWSKWEKKHSQSQRAIYDWRNMRHWCRRCRRCRIYCRWSSSSWSLSVCVCRTTSIFLLFPLLSLLLHTPAAVHIRFFHRFAECYRKLCVSMGLVYALHCTRWRFNMEGVANMCRKNDICFSIFQIDECVPCDECVCVCMSHAGQQGATTDDTYICMNVLRCFSFDCFLITSLSSSSASCLFGLAKFGSFLYFLVLDQLLPSFGCVGRIETSWPNHISCLRNV